jgi:hypothetical protein
VVTLIWTENQQDPILEAVRKQYQAGKTIKTIKNIKKAISLKDLNLKVKQDQ